MKKRKYFLLIRNMTRLEFAWLKEDGIKIFLPSYMPMDRFKKISTESELVYGETPELCMNILKNKYEDYDVFYLNISYISCENYKLTEFELSEQPDIVAAFVCIPKNIPEYKQKAAFYRKYQVCFTLQKYYNDSKSWEMYVVDENFSKNNIIDHHFFISVDRRYFTADKEFFKKCRIKYGIPQIELSFAKHIMNKKHVSERCIYKLTPEFMKKVRQQLRETQKDKKATK